MDTRKYRIENKTRTSSLSPGVHVIDNRLEPLAVLKVLIEGLAFNEDAGLWLTSLIGIPMVPRLAPIDLVYLDADQRVVQAAQLLPEMEIPPFRSPAISALVLPYLTITASGTAIGDTLDLAVVEDAELAPSPAPASPKPPPVRGPNAPIFSRIPKPAAPLPVAPAAPRPQLQREAVPVAAVLASAVAELELPVPQSRAASAAAEESLPAPVAMTPLPVIETETEAAEAKPILPKVTPEPLPEVQQPVEPALGPDLEYEALPAALALAKVDWPAPESRVVPAVAEEPAVARAAISPQPLIEPETPVPEVAPVVPAVQPEPATKIEPPRPAAPKAQPAMDELTPGLPQLKQKQAAESAQEKEKEKVVSRFLRWLYPGVYENERRKARRGYSPYLVAYDTTGGKTRVHLVGDISSTGIYLVTEERWAPGETRTLTLQRYGPPEDSPERKIELTAGTVRSDKSGIGLSFQLPTGMTLHLWEDPDRISGEDRSPDYILKEFRRARALAFVERICPQMVERAKKLLEHEFSHMRVKAAIEILLRTEEMLSHESEPDHLRAHAEILLRVLEDGSWADVDWIQRFWSGLLATSCTTEGFDESNKDFMEILSRLTPMHSRILVAVCARATKVRSGGGLGAKYPLYCTAEELIRISGSNDLSKVHRAIAQLADYGLLENSVRSTFISNNESAKTTPTELGLQMYARCTGHREMM